MNREAIQSAVQQIVEPNWKNKTLFLGDNLPVMRKMNSGLIDLIYLDPPFNSNRKYKQPIGDGGMREVFQDVWRETDLDQAECAALAERHPSLYGVIQAARAAHGGSMLSYLLMMAPRLLECRRLLKETGSIYLHCDPTASHYLKLVMDAVFGKDNFRNEIVWHYQAGTKGRKRFGRKHDYILCYGKSKQDAKTQNNPQLKTTFNPQRKPALNPKIYNRTEEETGRKYLVNGQGNKYYLDEGQTCDDVWTFIQEKEMNSLSSGSKERTGYPTQKPQALLERIIQASSNAGDVVLDPFCGCATTLVAAEKLGRHWIGIDVSPQSAKEIKKRIKNA